MNCENNNQILKVAIINLGCKVNKYESDSMKDKLSKAGFQIVEEDAVADIYIVNTCSVTNMAQKKSRQMLRRAKKVNPNAIIVAAGCYVNAEHEVLKTEKSFGRAYYDARRFLRTTDLSIVRNVSRMTESFMRTLFLRLCRLRNSASSSVGLRAT